MLPESRHRRSYSKMMMTICLIHEEVSVEKLDRFDDVGLHIMKYSVGAGEDKP